MDNQGIRIGGVIGHILKHAAGGTVCFQVRVPVVDDGLGIEIGAVLELDAFSEMESDARAIGSDIK
jgi:hypothetical protein